MVTRALALLLAILALAGCTRAEPTATYANPVLDADFPDPAVLLAPDGFYYAYATQTERDGRFVNVQVARSRDLVRWEHRGDALPAKPAWASKTQDFWAPHVQAADGRYFLYYSAKPDAALTDDKRGLCLAVATAARPEGPFVDMGRPLECGPGFENIDPFTLDDPETGAKLFYWGSGFGPIKVRALGPDRMSWAPGSAATDLVAVDKTDNPANYRRLVEGAWVIRRGGLWYLFFSGDNCCGPNAHYAVMVARARKATGPFEVRRDARGWAVPILERRGTWNAPGHNGFVRDAEGRDWMLYHAVDSRNPRAKPGAEVNTRRIMLLDPIRYEGGWPIVDGPSSGPRAAPTVQRGRR